MALRSQAASLMRLLFKQQHQLQAPPGFLALSQGTRFFSSEPSTKLFVGGLSWGTDDATLKQAFESFGEVLDAKVIMDRDTGRSKGYGFVSFTSISHAEAAIQQMDGREFAGRIIRVDFAAQRTPGMGRGDGGGFGYGGSSMRDSSSFGGGSYGGGSFGREPSFGGGSSFGSRPSFGNSGGQSTGSSFGEDSSFSGRSSFGGGSSFGSSDGKRTESPPLKDDSDFSFDDQLAEPRR